MTKIINNIISTSYMKGGENDGYPSWDRDKTEKEMVLLWKHFHNKNKI